MWLSTEYNRYNDHKRSQQSNDRLYRKTARILVSKQVSCKGFTYQNADEHLFDFKSLELKYQSEGYGCHNLFRRTSLGILA